VPRPPRSGPLLCGGLFLGVMGAVLASVTPPVAADSTVCEAIVIDYGTASASSPPPPATQVQGADIAPGSDDYDALQAANDVYALNNTGLLCALNNYPANGQENCDNTQGSQYFFWSYWEGDPYTNTWTYAEVGPAEHQVNEGQTYVQGWRYQNPGPASASAPRPSVTPAAAYAQACPGVTPVPAGSGGSGGGGGTTNTTTAPTQPAGATTTSTSAPVTKGATATTVAGAKGAEAGHTTTSTSAGRAGSTSTTTSDGANTTTTLTSSSGFGVVAKGTVLRSTKTGLASSADHHGSGGSGNPALPIVLLSVVVAGLGGAAWFRWRRRPTEE
jgi:hypothetical protein